MGTLFVYAIKSGICLAVFCLFYKFLLSNETFHKLNRAALLGILILSLVLPVFNFNFSTPAEFEIPLEFILMAQSSIALPQPEMAKITFVHFLLLAYILGIIFFAARNIFSIIKICILIKTGKKQRIENNITLVLTAGNISPFSWFRYIAICEKDFAENGLAIVEHEKAHITKRHSLDLLLCEMYGIVQWFNPAAWLFRRELQNIHEYQADETVINKGMDTKLYKLLLIQKAVGERLFAMANNFNNKKLQKRIKMMSKQKSNPYSRLKYLCILPLLALVVTVFANPKVQDEMNRISAVSINDFVPANDAGNENAYFAENSTTIAADTAIIIYGNDTIIMALENEKQHWDVLNGEIVDNIGTLFANIIILPKDSIGEHYQNRNDTIVVAIRQNGDKKSYGLVKSSTNGKTVIVKSGAATDVKYFSFPDSDAYIKINADSIYSALNLSKLNLDSLAQQHNLGKIINYNWEWDSIGQPSSVTMRNSKGEILKLDLLKHQINGKMMNLDSINQTLKGKMVRYNSNWNWESISIEQLLKTGSLTLPNIEGKITKLYSIGQQGAKSYTIKKLEMAEIVRLDSLRHQLNGKITKLDSIKPQVVRVPQGSVVRYYYDGDKITKITKLDSLGQFNWEKMNLDSLVEQTSFNEIILKSLKQQFSWKKMHPDSTYTLSSLMLNTRPLVILDDKEIKFDDMDKINPKQIESITILKDDEAKEEYGLRGHNGVIIINTKKKK